MRRHMGCHGEGLAPAGIGKLKEVAAARAFSFTIAAGHVTVYTKRKNISTMNFYAYFRHVLYYKRRSEHVYGCRLEPIAGSKPIEKE